ncbi:CotH kinase family protein [Mariprofundus ferrooxydans]|nr:CotH kinase family protein [Mariprofundus ferrooxydans]
MKLNKYLLLYLLPLLCIPWAVGALYAVEGDAYTLLDDLNLRQGPGSSYVSNSIVAQGERVIELDREGEWAKVRLSSNDAEGWVYAGSLAAVVAEARVASVAQPPKPAHLTQIDAVLEKPTQVEIKAQLSNEPQALQSLDIVSATTNQLGSVIVHDDMSLDAAAEQAAAEQAAAEQAAAEQAAAEQAAADQAAAEQAAADQAAAEQAAAEQAAADQAAADQAAAEQAAAEQAAAEQAAAEQAAAEQAAAEQAAVEETTPVLEQASSTAVLNDGLVAEAGSTPLSEPSRAKAEIADGSVLEAQALDVPPQQAGFALPNIAPETVQTTAANGVAKRAGVDGGEPRWFGFNKVANLRAGPDASFDVVAWATQHTQAMELARQGDWVRVQMQHNKRIGWVHNGVLVALNSATLKSDEAAVVKSDAVVERAPVDLVNEGVSPVVQQEAALPESKLPAPVAKTSQESAINQASNVLSGVSQVVAQTVMIRAEAGVLSEMIGWLGSGSQVQVLDQQGKWTQVRMQKSGRVGWIETAAFQQADAVDALAVEQAQVNENPVIIAGQQQANQVNGQPVAAPSNAASDAENGLYNFNKKATLRAGPGKKYDAVAWAGNGSQALLLDRKGEWIQVQMQESKRMGWVFYSSLHALKAAVQVASPVLVVAPDVVENVDHQASHAMYIFKRTSDMRAGPGEDYDRVGWGGRNESAEEIDHRGNWKHVRMTISGKRGWVFNSYLERVADLASSKGTKAASGSVVATGAAKAGRIYQVMRTEPLRSEAGDFSELIASVSKGDMVTWLEEKNGWAKVSPHLADSKAGWIQSKLLKQGDLRSVEHKQSIISKQNVVDYADRISTDKIFNYSFAALEEALYRVPVEDIHIRMDKDDLKALFLKRRYDKSSFDAQIKTGRHKLRGTVKVLGSSTRIFKKKSLLIKLDKESARWYGHRRIALRSMASDKALMREWMAWKMMAALGMKVPEVHFARLSFNHGEKTGLYLSIEWMGSEFLEGNGLDVRGEFYQPNDATFCGDLYSSDHLQTCFDKITPQDDDYRHLARMARALNKANNDDIDEVLGRYFDVESVINWITVNALLTNGDTYNKNYWLYFHPTEKKWTVIPWDYNLTFGRTYDQYGSREFRIFNDNFQYYYPPDVGAGNPMKDKALRNPKLRTQMETKIKHLIGLEPNGSEQTFGWFSPTVMHARIGNLATVVGKELYKDTFLSYGEDDFTKTYESLMHYVTAHDYFLKTKLFGDFEWNPEPPNQPYVDMPLPDQLLGFGDIDAGDESLHLIDRGWGYFVAHLELDKVLTSKAAFEVRVEGGITPKYLPTGQSPRRCIERSWLLRTKTSNISVMANVMFEYTQENSRRSEVPPSIHEELLELWMLDGNHWKPVETKVNEYSNTLVAKNVHIQSGHGYRFVACSPF